MQAGVPLHTRIHDNARGSFETDAKMLTQMLTNLAQNAAKYTSAGLVQVEARAVRAITDGVTEMELIVRDSGPGMPAESMQSCFQKYNTRGGTGLGLYLTKLQAEQLCGQIELKSRASPDLPGTEIRVTLPLRRSAPQSRLFDASAAAAIDVEPALKFTGGVRVLVADDMRLNRQLLRRAFTRFFGLDWTVDAVETAEEVLEALTAGHGFDLLVCDEIFSDVDPDCMRGSTVIRQLREREAAEGLPRLAIVSCTGNPSQTTYECGADDFWGKPVPSFSDGSLQKRVAMLLPQYVLSTA